MKITQNLIKRNSGTALLLIVSSFFFGTSPSLIKAQEIRLSYSKLDSTLSTDLNTPYYSTLNVTHVNEANYGLRVLAEDSEDSDNRYIFKLDCRDYLHGPRGGPSKVRSITETIITSLQNNQTREPLIFNLAKMDGDQTSHRSRGPIFNSYDEYVYEYPCGAIRIYKNHTLLGYPQDLSNANQ
jgi:hypothetical protein